MSKRILVPVVLLSITLCVGNAQIAAAAQVYWTPAKMAVALTTLSYPHQGVIGGSCAGLGKPRRNGTYPAFRCKMTWQIAGNATNGNVTTHGIVSTFARPLVGGRVCASQASLAACKPIVGPLAGDPRVCPLGNQSSCLRNAAENAIKANVGIIANLECLPIGTLVARCTWKGGSATVRFVQGKTAWTTTVTP